MSGISQLVKPYLPRAILSPLQAFHRKVLRAQTTSIHDQEKRDFYQHVHRAAGKFVVEVDPGLPWPEELRRSTSLLHAPDSDGILDVDGFFAGGYREMRNYLESLEKCSFNLRTVGDVLELGCGSARLIRHLRCLDGVRLVGSDLDPKAAEWCKQNVPGIEFHRNDLEPPLSFADDESFDLIIASSVFTHIPLDVQSKWLDEMARIMRPGGFFACTVLGKSHREKMLDSHDEETLKRTGKLTLDSNDPKASFSTKFIGSWDVFQTRNEVLKSFRRVFEVLDYIPGSQDLLILKKRSR